MQFQIPETHAFGIIYKGITFEFIKEKSGYRVTGVTADSEEALAQFNKDIVMERAQKYADALYFQSIGNVLNFKLPHNVELDNFVSRWKREQEEKYDKSSV